MTDLTPPPMRPSALERACELVEAFPSVFDRVSTKTIVDCVRPGLEEAYNAGFHAWCALRFSDRPAFSPRELEEAKAEAVAAARAAIEEERLERDRILFAEGRRVQTRRPHRGAARAIG